MSAKGLAKGPSRAGTREERIRGATLYPALLTVVIMLIGFPLFIIDLVLDGISLPMWVHISIYISAVFCYVVHMGLLFFRTRSNKSSRDTQ